MLERAVGGLSAIKGAVLPAGFTLFSLLCDLGCCWEWLPGGGWAASRAPPLPAHLLKHVGTPLGRVENAFLRKEGCLLVSGRAGLLVEASNRIVIWGYPPMAQEKSTCLGLRGHSWLSQDRVPGVLTPSPVLGPMAPCRPSCLGYFGLPLVPAVCWHHCPRAVWLEVASMVVLASPGEGRLGLQSHVSWP